jgi:hypothetical protein
MINPLIHSYLAAGFACVLIKLIEKIEGGHFIENITKSRSALGLRNLSLKV